MVHGNSQLLYLRHMCKFHLARDLLRGTPSELSNSLDIPEVVLRRLLEVRLSASKGSWKRVTLCP